MTRRSDDQLKPRNGHTLVTGVVARISGCVNQKEMSLDNHVDHAKEGVADMYDGPPSEFRVIATKGKGERLDRPELAEIDEAMIRATVPAGDQNTRESAPCHGPAIRSLRPPAPRRE